MSDQKSIELNRAICESYNQYFTYSNSTTFYALAPTYLFQYYNISVRLHDQWINGWVDSFHSMAKGLLPTQFAASLCQKVADLIYGDGVLFESKKEKNVENDALDFIGELDDRINIKGAFKDSVLKSTQLGNALIKVNVDKDGEVWLDCLAGNRFFVDLDSRGNVVRSRSYVNLYTGGIKQKGGKQDTYALVEERYYLADENEDYVLKDGKRVPVIEFKVYKLTAPANVFQAKGEEVSIEFGNLPREVRRAFRDEYGELEIGVPQVIQGFENLGVYLVKHTQYVTSIPNIKLGESCLARIINYLPKYDAIDSEETIDLRVSRPKVIVPDFMAKGKSENTDQLNDYDDIIFNKVANRSDKEQTPIVFIPNSRVDQLIKMKEDVIKKVCAGLGIATSSLFSDIADARGNVTAREIDSETSNTTLYQVNKRKIVLDAFNKVITDILAFYGYGDDVKVAFTPAGSTNKSVMVENTVKLVGAGLESEYQAIKENHPEWSDKQVEEELKEIHATKSENTEETKETEIVAEKGKDGKTEKKVEEEEKTEKTR